MAENWIGMSYYAGLADKYPVDKALRQIPAKIHRPATAIVWGSFGDNLHLIEAMAANRANVLLEIHISNECSRRSGRAKEGRSIMWRLNNAQYTQALITKRARPFIRKRLDEIKQTLAPLNLLNVKLLLSSGLEISVTEPRALYNLHQIIRTWVKQQDDPLFGGAEIVYSPNGFAKGRYDADLVEVHSQGCAAPAVPGADIWNMDGCSLQIPGEPDFFESMDSSRAFALYRIYKPRVFFGWSADQQGLRGVSDWGHGMSYSGRKYIFTDAARKEFRQLLLGVQRL